MQQLLGYLARYVQANGELLGAFMDGELVGVLGMIEPGRCRPTLVSKLRFACLIALSSSPVTVVRIIRWLLTWARKDPAHPHWHIGPLAVLEAYRRQGIGRRLMMHCCARIDALADAAYLETDLAVNAAFYEALGFVVIQQEAVLGVDNWFMVRPPSDGTPAGVIATQERRP